jgi:acyl carrier protein
MKIQAAGPFRAYGNRPSDLFMEEKLRQLLVELCQLPSDFDRSAHLYFDLGVPSVKAIELLMQLEEQFGVQVPDEEFVEAVSLEKLTSMMERAQGAHA